eukprot:363878-Chlamydomonas_euryale.AAC.11
MPHATPGVWTAANARAALPAAPVTARGLACLQSCLVRLRLVQGGCPRHQSARRLRQRRQL